MTDPKEEDKQERARPRDEEQHADRDWPKWTAITTAVSAAAGHRRCPIACRPADGISVGPLRSAGDGGLKSGDIVLGPEPGSPAAREKQRQRTTADCVFYIGLVITALGVILQTIGAVMPTD